MIFFSVSAAARMIPLPVLVSPVKAILSMPGCSTIACPTLEPGPVMTLSTPGGSPTSTAISPSAMAVSGVWLAGLRMTTLPEASAGATFHAASSRGKFQGTIAATTPSGSRNVYVR